MQIRFSSHASRVNAASPRFGQNPAPTDKPSKSPLEMTDEEFYENFPNIWRGYHGDLTPADLKKARGNEDPFPWKAFFAGATMLGAAALGLFHLPTLLAPEKTEPAKQEQVLTPAGPTSFDVMASLRRPSQVELSNGVDEFGLNEAFDWIKAQTAPVFLIQTENGVAGLTWREAFSTVMKMSALRQPITDKSLMAALNLSPGMNTIKDVRDFIDKLEALHLLYNIQTLAYGPSANTNVYQITTYTMEIPEVNAEMQTHRSAFSFPEWPRSQDMNNRRMWFATNPVAWLSKKGNVGAVTGAEVLRHIQIFQSIGLAAERFEADLQPGNLQMSALLGEMTQMGLVRQLSPEQTSSGKPELQLTKDGTALLDQVHFLQSDQFSASTETQRAMIGTGMTILGWLKDGPVSGSDFTDWKKHGIRDLYTEDTGQLYRCAVQLEKSGLATITMAEDGKQTLTITPAGRAWLEWQDAQAARTTHDHR